MIPSLSAEASAPQAGDPRTKHQSFSWARVGALASNTYLALVREKIFYFILLFALLAIGSTLIFSKFTFQEQLPAIKDVSLGGMSVFSTMLAILVTAMLLPKDLEDRTLYTILAKPVPRFEYLLGKLLGVLWLLATAMLLMTAVFLAILWYREQTAIAEVTQATPENLLGPALQELRASGFNANLIPAILAIFLKASLCASLTLLISTFATSWIFTVLVSAMCYLIGFVEATAREVWLEVPDPSPFAKIFLAVLSLLMPDLQIFSFVDDIAAGAPVPPLLFLQTAGLGIVYVGAYLLFGYLIFAVREL